MSTLEKPAGQAPVADFTAELGQLREAYEISYVFMDQALCFEEAGRLGEALEMYYKGLRYLNAGLDIRTDLPHCRGSEWEDARRMQRKMTRVREDAHTRIYALSSEKNPPNFAPPYSTAVAEPRPDGMSSRAGPSDGSLYPQLDSEFPPSYFEATESDPGSARDGYTYQAQSAPGAPPNAPDMMQMSARVLLSIPSGAQVFHISPNDDVQVESDATELKILTLNKAHQPITPQTVSWIQVGDFTYPLVPKKSPVLKTGYGAYVFPEISTQSETTSSIAIVLRAEVSEVDRILLDELLKDYAAFQEQPQIGLNPDEVTLGQKVSDGIVSASEVISRGLVKGAQVTSVALNYGAEKLRERLTPQQRAYMVDPRVQTGLKVARTTTHYTCKVTGFMVSVVGDMTMALGRKIAKSIAQPEVIGGVQTNAALNDALLIAGGGLTGFGKVFMGLENAAKVLAQSITTNTVTLVHHKYGGDAGEAVGDALYSVGNLALTANNVTNLGVRGIAKRTAKDAGKAVLEEYVTKTSSSTVVVEPADDRQPGPSGRNDPMHQLR
ncbi:spartin [Galendromus occidentalis]|uniref:Spartin n=1 Tax=Galendromus occidentalis TaxID=34638 RepID=A0AAJ6QS20_9ACAR|nr:spartin [Galendromus occidentalis]